MRVLNKGLVNGRDRMVEPKDLPIRQYSSEIVDSVRTNPVTIVIGETGSGKTTQISQILEEAGFADNGVIGITQPRRVVSFVPQMSIIRRLVGCNTARHLKCNLTQLLLLFTVG